MQRSTLLNSHTGRRAWPSPGVPASTIGTGRGICHEHTLIKPTTASQPDMPAHLGTLIAIHHSFTGTAVVDSTTLLRSFCAINGVAPVDACATFCAPRNTQNAPLHSSTMAPALQLSGMRIQLRHSRPSHPQRGSLGLLRTAHIVVSYCFQSCFRMTVSRHLWIRRCVVCPPCVPKMGRSLWLRSRQTAQCYLMHAAVARASAGTSTGHCR